MLHLFHFQGVNVPTDETFFLVAELPTKDETLETNIRYLLLCAFLH